jgi:hypothetical protein
MNPINFGLVAAAGFLVAAMLVACDKPSNKATSRSQAAFVQSEFAKNPDGDCVAHPTDYYDERATSQKGLQELTFLTCQYQTRSDYHAKKLDDAGKDQRDAHLQIALRCGTESLAALKAMQKAGVTKLSCDAL